MKRSALCLLLLLFSGCVVKKLSPEAGNPKWGLDITWHGHSCFTLKDSVDRMVVIDPFDETVGYGRLDLKADALLMTHNHFDHNFRRAVTAHMSQIDLAISTGTVSVAEGMQVTGLPSIHDDSNGDINGLNSIYIFVMGGLRCVHLGDLGTPKLTEYQRNMIGKVDVLFIPVGGKVTLDAAAAKKVVDELKPSIIFPMHYGSQRFYPLDGVEKFTSLFSKDQVNIISDSHIRLYESELTDKPVVYILSPTPKN